MVAPGILKHDHEQMPYFPAKKQSAGCLQIEQPADDEDGRQGL